ncbi:MAG TPA: STAS domain-containing protein [Kofleriaceae bacterium]
MANTVPTRLRLTAEDKRLIKDYWEFIEPHMKQVNEQLRQSLLELPEWAPIIKAMPPSLMEKQNEESRLRQRAAAVDGNWAPYLEDTRQQGMNYAKMGVSFVAWYDIIAIYREVIRQKLIEQFKHDMGRAAEIGTGMNRMIDIAMSHLGEAYLAAKEKIIGEQQEAIRELSLPVLQIRDHLLIIPLVGIIDGQRARQLIETLLAAIRDRRARGVVVDVTGVPVVDTGVANTLVQVCDAARLMGTMVVITGISPDMAQTLVGLGARLPANETLVDLQEGVDYIERALGYRDGSSESSDAPQVAEDRA